ncbi:MAG TPA: hypothetical protein VFL80_07210 [Thermoanaerobaculia bacterium]|nr:hypothetical protein [Thermoanaerobaculia bacterium]
MELKRLGTAVAAALILATAPAAMAHGKEKVKKHRGGDKMRHELRDTNNDGVVSRSEWRGDSASFDRLDSNRDGVLSGAEVSRGKVDKKRSMDLNGDGVISRSEWTKDAEKFDRLDVNRNGVLSADELRYGKHAKHAKGDRDMRFHGIDKNDDGVITRGEWPGNDQSFRNHDRNRDGILSGNELRSGKRD